MFGVFRAPWREKRERAGREHKIQLLHCAVLTLFMCFSFESESCELLLKKKLNILEVLAVQLCNAKSCVNTRPSDASGFKCDVNILFPFESMLLNSPTSVLLERNV